MKSKLLTKAILRQFEKVGCQMDQEDPLIICKFFDPCSQRTWYATEFEPERGVFFGYVRGFFDERGTFSLEELQSFTGLLGIGIERDKFFRPCKFSELKGV